MLSPELTKMIKPMIRTQFIVWGAFLVAPVLYAIVVYFLVQKMDSSGSSLSSLFVMVMQICALLSVAAGLMYRRYTLSERALKKQLKLSPEEIAEKAGTTRAPESFKTEFAALSAAEQKILGLVSYSQSTMIVSLALVEAVAVIGLILVFFGRQFMLSIPYLIVSIGLVAMFRPRPGDFIKETEALVKKSSEQ